MEHVKLFFPFFYFICPSPWIYFHLLVFFSYNPIQKFNPKEQSPCECINRVELLFSQVSRLWKRKKEEGETNETVENNASASWRREKNSWKNSWMDGWLTEDYILSTQLEKKGWSRWSPPTHRKPHSNKYLSFIYVYIYDLSHGTTMYKHV